MSAPKGGIKLRRCAKRAPKYKAQFQRTRLNKIRRLRGRELFDPQATKRIAEIIAS